MVSFATTLYRRRLHTPPTPLGPGIKIHSQPRYMHGFICNHAIYVVSFATTLYMWFHSQPRYIAWFHMQPRYIDDVFIPLPPPSGLGSKFTHNHDICMVSFATTLYTWFHMQPRYIDDVFIPRPPPSGLGSKFIHGFIRNHAIHVVSFATTLYRRRLHTPPTPLGPGIKIHSQPRYMHGFMCNHAIYVVSLATTLYAWFHSQPRYIAWFHMQPRYIDDVFIPLPPPSGLGSKFTHNHDICMVSFATTLYTWFHIHAIYTTSSYPAHPPRAWDQNSFMVSFATTLYTWFHMQPRYIDDGFIPRPPPSGLGSKFIGNHAICMVSCATTLYTWFHWQPRYTRGFIRNHAI